MSEREIAAAALRWYAARDFRISTNKRRGKTYDANLDAALTEARRLESAALLNLRRECKKHRDSLKQVDDAEVVIDVKMLELA